MVNRTQALVLGFFGAAWIAFVLILVAAPDVYQGSMGLDHEDDRAAFAVLASISLLIGLLAVGVLRRWRWAFWLILIAFLAGVLRVPVTVLELTRQLHAPDPTWYVLVQGFSGLVQFSIGLAMLAGRRKGGVWGAF